MMTMSEYIDSVTMSEALLVLFADHDTITTIKIRDETLIWSCGYKPFTEILAVHELHNKQSGAIRAWWNTFGCTHIQYAHYEAKILVVTYSGTTPLGRYVITDLDSTARICRMESILDGFELIAPRAFSWRDLWDKVCAHFRLT